MPRYDFNDVQYSPTRIAIYQVTQVTGHVRNLVGDESTFPSSSFIPFVSERRCHLTGEIGTREKEIGTMIGTRGRGHQYRQNGKNADTALPHDETTIKTTDGGNTIIDTEIGTTKGAILTANDAITSVSVLEGALANKKGVVSGRRGREKEHRRTMRIWSILMHWAFYQ